MTQKAFEKYGFSAAALITDWATIVGKDVAAYTDPERLRWPRSLGAREEIAEGEEGRPGATLVLRVEPARALDVQYRTRQLMERINAYFGYRAVAEVRIVQGPIARVCKLPKPPTLSPPSMKPSAELAAVPDEALRSALSLLAASVAGNPSRRARIG